jgi:uncharacterized protein (DUF983 family)
MARTNGRHLIAAPASHAEAADPRERPRLRTVRCACRRCGAHVMARGLHVLSGECGNCHGLDLIPLD